MKRKPENTAGLYVAWRNPKPVRKKRGKVRRQRPVTEGYAFQKWALAYQEELMRRRG